VAGAVVLDVRTNVARTNNKRSGRIISQSLPPPSVDVASEPPGEGARNSGNN